MNIETTIARVLELDEKATPGPWSPLDDYDGTNAVHGWRGMYCPKTHGGFGGQGLLFATHLWDVGLMPQDIHTIAEYRTAAPELARECRRHNVEICAAANRLSEFRQRIIDAACLRDDVEDDDLVDAVRRLASPSGEVSDG